MSLRSDSNLTKEASITRSSDRRTFNRKRSGFDKEKPKQPARKYAIWLLSKWEYSAEVLKRKLVLRGYSQEEAADAISFAVENGFQSDERYACSKARAAQNRAGDLKIALALKQKGISPEVSKSQIAALPPEEERARRAASKFKSQLANQGMNADLKQKIYRSLGSRGFSSKSVKAAIDELSQPTEI